MLSRNSGLLDLITVLQVAVSEPDLADVMDISEQSETTRIHAALSSCKLGKSAADLNADSQHHGSHRFGLLRALYQGLEFKGTPISETPTSADPAMAEKMLCRCLSCEQRPCSEMKYPKY